VQKGGWDALRGVLPWAQKGGGRRGHRKEGAERRMGSSARCPSLSRCDLRVHDPCARSWPRLSASTELDLEAMTSVFYSLLYTFFWRVGRTCGPCWLQDYLRIWNSRLRAHSCNLTSWLIEGTWNNEFTIHYTLYWHSESIIHCTLRAVIERRAAMGWRVCMLLRHNRKTKQRRGWTLRLARLFSEVRAVSERRAATGWRVCLLLRHNRKTKQRRGWPLRLARLFSKVRAVSERRAATGWRVCLLLRHNRKTKQRRGWPLRLARLFSEVWAVSESSHGVAGVFVAEAQ